MKACQIYVSCTRYSSTTLHGNNYWFPIKRLGDQARGTYTANVDGREGEITIDASGWWFTERQAEKPSAAVTGGPTPCRSADDECRRLRALLREWLSIDHWEDEDIAPADLVTRTRLAVDHPLSPEVSS